MKTTFVLKRHFSVGQKLNGGSAFGEGFNYTLEAGFALAAMDQARAEEAVRLAIAKIDHRALGVDLDIGVEPTSENLCRYLAGEITSHHGLEWLRLIRGDGAIFNYNSQTE